MSRPTLPASAYDALELSPETVKILTKPASTTTEASPNLLQNTHEPKQRLVPNETSITLYAELLLHIRTVTLFASLRSFHTRETKAQLSTDGCSITVTHEGQTATIRLPIRVKGGGNAAFSLPVQPPSKELTLRLQIEEKEGTDLLGAWQSEKRNANVVPWDGTFINNISVVQIVCRECQAVIVPARRIGEWRDLPNENWAEMMDFWHCHKPNEHHLHNRTHHDAVGRKGYAAGNRLQAIDSVGFVDLASFLLKEYDCTGAVILAESKSRGASLFCKQCKATLGTQEESADGWRIWKWCVGLYPETMSKPIAYSTQKWISARLLFLIENQGVRKFHIYPDTDEAWANAVPSLLVWVFTPDLFYSSSIESDGLGGPNRSIKIFYKNQTHSAPRPGEPESSSIEDVPFPEELYGELQLALEKSQILLPANARTFQGWEVGLLERFDIMDMDNIP